MRTIKKSVTRILSFALVAVMLFGAVPISSMAATDAPLTGEVGSGWEDLGDLPSSNETPSTTPEQP